MSPLSTIMEQNSFHAKQDSNFVPIRSWVCINQPLSAQYDYGDDISESEDDDEDYSAMASKHRKSLLKVATKFADGWTRPARKRKCDIETAKVHKKLKLEIPFEPVGLSKTRKSSANKKPVAEGRKIRATRAPVKRYLRSAKESRLDMTSESRLAPDTTPEPSLKAGLRRFCPAEHSSVSPMQQNSGATCVTNSDTETPRPISTLSTAQSPKLKSNDESDGEILTDLDDSIFDEEELTLGNMTNLTELDAGDIESPVQPESPDSDSAIDACDQSRQDSYQSPVLPFLRAAPEDPVQDTENSPIPKITASLRIPTCFRIAEALRLFKSISSSSDTSKAPLTIELFTKVSGISILGNKTLRLRLTDIFFPYNPPFITGSYSGEAFRGGTRNSDTIYRTIVSMPAIRVRSSSFQQGGLASQYVQVLAVREADWDEIRYVYGIVDPEGAEKLKKRS